jgi:AraC family transcriptional regulator
MIAISETALAAAADETPGKVELRSRDNLVDARLGALAPAVNAERSAGFPSGRLFLDSIEQALAVALVMPCTPAPWACTAADSVLLA